MAKGWKKWKQDLARAEAEKGHDLLTMLFIFLSQREWKLCYAVIFVSDVEGFEEAYDLEKFETPDLPDHMRDTWSEAFRQAIRLIGLDGRYDFEGLVVRNDGTITTKGATPVCLGNAIYRDAIGPGHVQHDDALRVGLELGEEAGIWINLEPMRQVWADVTEAKKWAIQDTDPEMMAAWEKVADESLAELGIKRIYDKQH